MLPTFLLFSVRLWDNLISNLYVRVWPTAVFVNVVADHDPSINDVFLYRERPCCNLLKEEVPRKSGTPRACIWEQVKTCNSEILESCRVRSAFSFSDFQFSGGVLDEILPDTAHPASPGPGPPAACGDPAKWPTVACSPAVPGVSMLRPRRGPLLHLRRQSR